MYYKILKRTEEGLLVSPFINIEKYKVQYMPNKRTYPKIGKLFVWNTLEYCDKDLEIWECEVGNPIEWKTAVNLNSIIKEEGLVEYWNTVDITTSNIIPYLAYAAFLVHPTKGTYACEWVEIKEQVS